MVFVIQTKLLFCFVLMKQSNMSGSSGTQKADCPPFDHQMALVLKSL